MVRLSFCCCSSFVYLFVSDNVAKTELEPLPAWKERCILKDFTGASPYFHIMLLLDDERPPTEILSDQSHGFQLNSKQKKEINQR